jgi:hypothetical protein
MGRKLVRITKDFRRVVTIGDVKHVVTIGVYGLTLRRLGARQSTATPLKWIDMAREGGLLDAHELSTRPLLAACVQKNCGQRENK